MGSSLPTPVLSSKTSPAADDALRPAEAMHFSDEDENPAELSDAPTRSVHDHPDGASETATSAPKVLKHLKGKEKDVAIASRKKRPLQLLDLPVDILKEIIKEVQVNKAHEAHGWLMCFSRSRILTTLPRWRSLTQPYTILRFPTYTLASTLYGQTHIPHPNLE